MKIIKKITAMMLSIMMVLGMCSVVGATGATEKGTIKINNAIEGQTYKIYKMLTLESYEPATDSTGKKTGLYSYKPANDQWKEFFEKGAGQDYVTINENGYVEWKAGVGEEKAADLAQKALTYATDSKNQITAVGSVYAQATTVTFNNLDLGYYLVDSILGALCDLTTTNLNVEILEKNGVPTVDKKVYEGTDYADINYANIGDTVSFKITVHVKKGACNYKLYDKMSDGFILNDNAIEGMPAIQVYSDNKDIDISATDYTIYVDKNKKGFQIQFNDTFLEKYKDKDYDITIVYSATLTGDATIGKDNGNTNTAYLTYGDTNTESNKPITNTYTFGIPVFKYTGTNTALAGAKFSLHSEQTCVDDNRIDLIKVGETETYRRFITGDADASKVTAITTTSTGKFSITGLKPGTYYLKEIAAPKGYNVLAKPVKIEVTSEGTIKVDNGTAMEQTNEVKVKNNAGSLLPSTGGMGTTVFYIAGALLVLISGVVLIAKKRTDSK